MTAAASPTAPREGTTRHWTGQWGGRASCNDPEVRYTGRRRSVTDGPADQGRCAVARTGTATRAPGAARGPRPTAERVRKARLVERYGDRVAAVGLRVGYDDEDGPRALVPARLRDVREPLRRAGCALYPARASADGDTPGAPPDTPSGSRAGETGGASATGGRGAGHGPGSPGDADYRLAVERAVVRVHRDLEPVTALVVAGTKPPAVADVAALGSGALDATQADLLRSLYLELVDTVGAQRSKILARLDRLVEDHDDDDL